VDKNTGPLIATFVLASTTLASSAAFAVLEETVVTAQKHAQSANDVGMTVNAFTGEMLKNFGVKTASDIPALTPGLTVSEVSVTGVPVYTIRGVGFQDISTGSSSTVGLYFDEVSIPYTVMSRGALFDLARVEVLKGPQGDLYGRNTTAGQINFISNKPTEEFEAGFTASYGNYEVFDLEGYVSGALLDNVQARLSFDTTQSSEGWQDSLTNKGDELGEQDIYALRTLFNIDVTDRASVLLNVHYWKDQSDNQAPAAYDGTVVGLGQTGAPYVPLNEYVLPTGEFFGQTPPWYASGEDRDAAWTNDWTSPITGKTFDLRPQRDNEEWGVSANLTWDFDNYTLNSITAYDHFERDEAANGDGVDNSVQENINKSKIEVFSQELRLTGQTDKLLWIAGLYYSWDQVEENYAFFMEDSIFGNGSAAFGLPLPFARSPIYQLDTRYKQTTDSVAAFGHIEYNLTDKLGLTLGARYTEEDREWDGCTFDGGDGSQAAFVNSIYGTTLQPGDCGLLDDIPGSPTNITKLVGTPNVNEAFHPVDPHISVGKWMGKVGFDYAFTDDLLAYITWSRGFKSGGFNGAQANTASQLKPYKPEELDALEIGTKATLFDSTLQVNASAFYYDYKDKQELERSVTAVGLLTGLGNIPKSEIYGAELDIQWAPLEGLLFNLGGAYLDSEIKQWETIVSGNYDFATGMPINVVYQDASGESLPQSPEWSYNALVRYEWSIGNGLMMDIGADVNFTDDMPDPVRTQNSVESFRLFNARIGISDESGQWRAAIWGRNVTDENYYAQALGGINGPYVRMAGRPRTYGVSLEYAY
jgi:iron complex outermembrane receptor protein